MTKAEPWELFRFLDKQWKYIAMDKGGDWNVHSQKPYLSGNTWDNCNSGFPGPNKICLLTGNPHENVNWKDTVLNRDDYKEQLGENDV